MRARKNLGPALQDSDQLQAGPDLRKLNKKGRRYAARSGDLGYVAAATALLSLQTDISCRLTWILLAMEYPLNRN